MNRILEIMLNGVERGAKNVSSINLQNYGIDFYDPPIDWSESRVLLSKKSPDGKRKVVKIFDTPFAQGAIDVSTIKKYMELANRAALLNFPEIVIHDNQGYPITCFPEIIPIEKAGNIAGYKTVPAIVCPYIEGPNLGTLLYRDYKDLFSMDKVQKMLEELSAFINGQLNVTCVDIINWNVKPSLEKDLLTLSITDICSFVSKVSGREPNYENARQQFGNIF